MDEITSNINITCDMLIAIVRNLIILTNTSSNISPEAVKALLEDASSSTAQAAATVAPSNGAQAPSSTQTGSSLLLDNINQYHYHLYHPLYTNSQLNQYKIGAKGQPSTSETSDKSKEK
jgi:hypothetical protein